MMKDFIKKILVLGALMILTIYTISSIRNEEWSETIFFWQLILLSVIISVVQLLLNRYRFDYYIIEVLVEYLMVCLVVGTTGMIFGWFELHYLWMVLLYVTPIYMIGYFLDMVRTKRDVDYINERIEVRRKRGIKVE